MADVRYGIWLTQASPVMVEAAARSGVDWVSLDLQHGMFDLDSARHAIQILNLCGVESFARAHYSQADLMARLLDHGLDGAIFASVEDAATVRRLVSAVTYMPAGERSWAGSRFGMGTQRPTWVGGSVPVHLVFETRGAVRDIREIASIPGVAGFALGPADLALAHGVEPLTGPADPQWRVAVETMVATAQEFGLDAWGYPTASGLVTGEGFTRVAIAGDLKIFQDGMRQQLADARGLQAAAGAGSYGADPAAVARKR
jgi:2-keto-3-deoxy-L-rhamnonate aldolase RhmA